MSVEEEEKGTENQKPESCFITDRPRGSEKAARKGKSQRKEEASKSKREREPARAHLSKHQIEGSNQRNDVCEHVVPFNHNNKKDEPERSVQGRIKVGGRRKRKRRGRDSPHHKVQPSEMSEPRSSDLASIRSVGSVTVCIPFKETKEEEKKTGKGREGISRAGKEIRRKERE